MGNKDHRNRETKKPKKKKDDALKVSPARRGDFNPAGLRAIQETIKRSES
jgi:hypothetical protein